MITSGISQDQMREDEEAETHVFQASSSWGVFEGTVTVIEKKEEN